MSFGLSNHTVLCYISHTNVGNAFAYFKHVQSEIVVLTKLISALFVYHGVLSSLLQIMLCMSQHDFDAKRSIR